MLEPILHDIRQKNIVLASTSPRRSELLSKLGIEFEVFPSSFDESTIDPSEFSDKREYCKTLAYEKGHKIAKELLSYKDNVDLIISADTIVELDGKIYEKPKNDEDADKILTTLSGKKHRVISAVCIIICKNKSISDSVEFYEETDVFMTDLTPEMVKSYVATREPLGKAGAYAIQGVGASFIRRIEGDFYNVMGLPVHRLCKALSQICVEMAT